MIPYGRQDINDADIKAVVEVLRSDFLTQGPRVPSFENGVVGYTGASYATAVNSATSALHIACLALGVGPGDVVWTSPISFVASANCALYCGASVDFVDVDPKSGNMSLAELRAKLEAAAETDCLPKVIIPVHLCGEPCDMAAIHALSLKYGFKIIEDASHAIGSTYDGVPVGSCKFSDVTVFSFHPVKIITSAEGGMAMTNSEEIHKRLQLLRSHGVTREPDQMTDVPEGAWVYEQVALGFNYRLTDLQAALGLSQLGRADEFVERRQYLAGLYDERLAAMPVTPLERNVFGRSALHLYVIRLDGCLAHKRGQVFEAMRAAGIGVNIHYIPIHTQPYYRQRGFSEGMFPRSEEYYAEALTLPLHPGLTEKDVSTVCQALQDALS